MRVAVYGGSFNPPHVGHAMVVAWLRWTRQVDAVWMVPVYRHAFEGVHDKSLAPFEQRLAWCRALVQSIGSQGSVDVDVLDIEARLPVPSFTIDTLRALAKEHPGAQFVPVVGADVVPQLPRWREWQTLRERFPPLVVGRAGCPSPPGSISFPDVSSSDIRRRLLLGQTVEYLVPADVLALLEAQACSEWWSGS